MNLNSKVKKNYIHKKKLYIISLPIQRLIRTIYSEDLIKPLTKNGDVLIISQFSENKIFRQKYKYKNLYFLNYKKESSLNNFSLKLNGFLNVLRWFGYFRRIKDKMPYYWHNRFWNFFLDDFKNKRSKFFYNTIDLLSFLGFYRSIWFFISNLIGNFIYKFPELESFTEKYKKIILIQNTSWHYIDLKLGYFCRKNNWKSVLIPYSKDQLQNTGHLLCDYDMVFAQGDKEERFAKSFHNISPKRIRKVGSLNIFKIREVYKELSSKYKKENGLKRIFFSSIAPIQFPLELELDCVEFLLVNARKGLYGNVEITYRLQTDLVPYKVVKERFKNYPELQINYAPKEVTGIEELSGIEEKKIFTNYVKGLISYDLNIMAYWNSLAIDACALNIPSISFLGNKHQFNIRRKIKLHLNNDNRLIDFEETPVANNLSDLHLFILKFINKKNYGKKYINKTLKDWDTNNDRVYNDMTDLIRSL